MNPLMELPRAARKLVPVPDRRDESAIVCVSGGLDSAVLTNWAVLAHGYKQVALLYVKYGQPSQEQESHYAGLLKIHYRIRPMLWIDMAWLEGMWGYGVPEAPDYIVPQRNMQIIAAAASWAEVIGVDRIYLGALADDQEVFPDCREEFASLMSIAIRWSSKSFPGRAHVEFPLVDLTKWEVVQMGGYLGTPLELTWSCYNGENEPCGECASCIERVAAFEAVGIEDPAWSARAAELREERRRG